MTNHAITDGTMNSAIQQYILKEKVQLSGWNLKIMCILVFQQDSDPKHTVQKANKKRQQSDLIGVQT